MTKPLEIELLASGPGRVSAPTSSGAAEYVGAEVAMEVGPWPTDPVPLHCFGCKRKLCEVRPPVGHLSIKCKRCGFQNGYTLK